MWRRVALLASRTGKPPPPEGWVVRKTLSAMHRSDDDTPSAWRPIRKLPRATMDRLRFLHLENPQKYSHAALADQFGVSFEAVRRILHSKWSPAGRGKDDDSWEGMSWEMEPEPERPLPRGRPASSASSAGARYQKRGNFTPKATSVRKTGEKKLAPLPLQPKRLEAPSDTLLVPRPPLPRRPTERSTPQELWAMVASEQRTRKRRR